jgi:hypothetical protein
MDGWMSTNASSVLATEATVIQQIEIYISKFTARTIPQTPVNVVRDESKHARKKSTRQSNTQNPIDILTARTLVGRSFGVSKSPTNWLFYI